MLPKTHVIRITLLIILLVIFALQDDASSTIDTRADNARADVASLTYVHWPPPELEDPITIQVSAGYRDGPIRLRRDRDYILEMPDAPILEELAIRGGRNVILMGGEIRVDWQGAYASTSNRSGLLIFDTTGTFHVEGLYIHGDDLTEGIQINAPEAIVQIQNVRIEEIRARDQVNFSDNHPDLIQTYGNVKELRVDKFTGTSDYQGIFLKADYHGVHGEVHLRRVNIIGTPTARYLLWFHEQSGAGDVTLNEVYVDVPDERRGGFGNAVWPPVSHSFPRQAQLTEDGAKCPCISWPEEMRNPRVTGTVYLGRPASGDFVKRHEVGIGYEASGFVGGDGGDLEENPFLSGNTDTP